MTDSARRKEGRRQTRPSLCTTMPPFAIAAGHADSDLSCSFLPGNLVSVNLTAAKEVKEETFRTELRVLPPFIPSTSLSKVDLADRVSQNN